MRITSLLLGLLWLGIAAATQFHTFSGDFLLCMLLASAFIYGSVEK